MFQKGGAILKMLSIGQVAKETDLSIETLRFYERSGLIPEPPRKESGYRQYPEEIIPVLKFIRNAKDLGFTLNEIKELLSLRCTPGATKSDVRDRTNRKIAEIDRKIAMMERMKKTLTNLVKGCDGKGPASECPILDALLDEEADVATTDKNEIATSASPPRNPSRRVSKAMMCHHYGHKKAK
jgi:MerR family transcriptional regulator, copper efflux regulator